MNLEYPEGSIVICVKFIELEAEPESGQRVVVYRHAPDGEIEATIKEFQIDDAGYPWLWPRSTSPEFQEPIKVNDGDEIEIVALVIGSYRPENP